jgi:zinc transporter, ZIP family
LYQFFSDVLFGVLFCMIAGIMIFVAVDELLPTSQRYEDHHISVYGFIIGMMVMAISLSLFGHSH